MSRLLAVCRSQEEGHGRRLGDTWTYTVKRSSALSPVRSGPFRGSVIVGYGRKTPGTWISASNAAINNECAPARQAKSFANSVLFHPAPAASEA